MTDSLLPELQKKLDAMDEDRRNRYLVRIINQAYELHRLFTQLPGETAGDEKEPDRLDEESENMLLGGLDI